MPSISNINKMVQKESNKKKGKVSTTWSHNTTAGHGRSRKRQEL
jgi:hypothetical protein